VTIGEALNALKAGSGVRRSFWGPDTFLILKPSDRITRAVTINGCTAGWTGRRPIPDSNRHLVVFDTNSGVQYSWICTQSDVLADDWHAVILSSWQ
jgi:hypothetical protein